MRWSVWNPIVYPLIDVSSTCSDVRFPLFREILVSCFRDQFALYDPSSKTILDTIDNVIPTSGEAIGFRESMGGIYDVQKHEIDHKYRFTQDYIAPPAVSLKGASFVVQQHVAWYNKGGVSTQMDVLFSTKLVSSHHFQFGPVWVDEQNDIWLYQSKHHIENIVRKGDFPRYLTSADDWIFWVEDHKIQGWEL